MKKNHDYRSFKLERLQNPDFAKVYLETVLEESQNDSDQEAFLGALRDVVEAQGGVPEIAKRVDMPKQSLYHAFSKRGNPRMDTLSRVLKSLGLRISVEAIK